MPTATTSNYAPNRDEVIRQGLELAGVLNLADTPSPEQLDRGAKYLINGMLALQNLGIQMRTRVYESLTLVPGTYIYTTPSDTLDVEPGAVVRDTNGQDSPSDIIGQREYFELVDKTLQGRPYNYYPAYTSDAVTLYLYQVPDTSWVTFIYPRTRRVRDLTAGNLNLDCPTKWIHGMTIFMAWMFSVHYRKPVDRCEMYRMMWEGTDGTGGEKYNILQADTAHGPTNFVIDDLFVRC